jgi:hypothetical protein
MATPFGWLVLYPVLVSGVQGLFHVLVAVPIFLSFSLLGQCFSKGFPSNSDARGCVKYL